MVNRKSYSKSLYSLKEILKTHPKIVIFRIRFYKLCEISHFKCNLLHQSQTFRKSTLLKTWHYTKILNYYFMALKILNYSHYKCIPSRIKKVPISRLNISKIYDSHIKSNILTHLTTYWANILFEESSINPHLKLKQPTEPWADKINSK